MNEKRDFDRAVDQWLDEGSDATPPEVIDGVLLAVRSTPQERDFRVPWRTTSMTYLRVAAVILLAVMAGTVAISTFGPWGSGFGGTNATPSPSPTLENGQAVPVPYSLLGGEVSFAAAPPWSYTYHDRKSTTLGGVGLGSASQFTMFTVVADPLTVEGAARLARLPPTPRRSSRTSGPTPISRRPLRWQ